ncbi:TniQ family protein [Janthinobacterium sp. GMG2]|uniref:TniQ family protein n=1 Tax=Janthinobacterium sp. GMG2 TaxID=3096606 RepID=UPI0029F4ABB6|nr:TniQ family protein [Janthinobacterium sp. GMG2]MDX8123106.1 TniQ family protein [Janthinobacterium sp. GMG2]
MKLPVLPFAFSDESAAGFILRVAFRNGWSSPNAFIRGLGGGVGSGVSLARMLEHFDLLSLFGLEVPDGLVELCMARRVYPKRYRFAEGIDLPPAAFREDCSAVCPECLKVSPHIRQIWTLDCYTTCHIHGVQLMRSCDACDLPLTYHRSAPHLCSCGADLSCAKTSSGDIASAKKLHLLVAEQKQDELAVAADVFGACREAFCCDAERNSSTIAQYTSPALAAREYFVLWLAEYVKGRSTMEHPRLLLVPFLRSAGALHDAAISALRILDGMRLTNLREEKISGYLNRRDACHALGLNSHRVIARLGYLGLLSDAPFNAEDRGLVVSRAHINRLLIDLYRPERDAIMPVRALTRPLDELIQTGLNLPASVIGYSLSAGLTTFRLHVPLVDRQHNIPSGFISLSQAAKMLGVHKDVVRSASRLGHIKAVPGRRGTSPLIFERDEISNFDAMFVFASSIARAMGIEPMKFSTKLFAADVKPVAGPTINGLLMYLFDRNDLAHVHLRVLAAGKSVPFSGVTRFVNMAKRLDAAQPSISISEIGEDLSIPHTDVAKIVRSGCLERVVVPGREVRVCQKSYAAYKAKFLDPNIIDIVVAAKMSGETLQEFRSNWIETQLVNVIDLGLRRCIAQDEFIRVQAFRSQYVTARQAVFLTQKGRHTLPNLEVRGAISSIREGGRRKIRLFDRMTAGKLFW